MCTARSSLYRGVSVDEVSVLGGLPDRDPQTETPMERPPRQRPPGQRPRKEIPWIESPGQRTLERDSPGQRLPWTETPWTETPWKEHGSRQQDIIQWHHTETPCGQTDACKNITLPLLGGKMLDFKVLWISSTRLRFLCLKLSLPSYRCIFF